MGEYGGPNGQTRAIEEGSAGRLPHSADSVADDSFDELRRRYDLWFDGQSETTEWPRQMEAQLSDWLSLWGERLTVHTVECREHGCRLVMQFGDDGAAGEFIGSTDRPPINTGRVQARMIPLSEAAYLEVSYYFTREGVRFPDIE